ncbi:MAG: DUF4173 domain-containing protein [Chitinophagales bacterium]
MKKESIFILLSTAAYSYLFYEQMAGINFLLFNILLVALLAINKPALLKEKNWLAVVIGCLISSFCIFWYGTWLPTLANITSLLFLAGLSFAPQASLLIAGINSLVTFPFAIPATLFRKSPEAENAPAGYSLGRWPVLITPVFLTVIFFFVYRTINPVFENLTNRINLDFLNGYWLFFTTIGFVLMYAVFSYFPIKSLFAMDQKADDVLVPKAENPSASDIFGLSLQNQLLAGTITFVLLNVLLLFVNGGDIFYLWFAKTLPKGLTMAQYLHDGTDGLIFSIILAVLVILFVFRSHLNFIENNKWLKVLAYGWVAQNIILVLTTAQRNWWTIESSGLTRRRIGVYVYLLLCIIGLLFTLIKVARRKSNTFLFRKNSWAFYAVFIASCPVNWDAAIVNFNYTNYKSNQFQYIDRSYQAELSETSLLPLFKHYAQELQKPSAAHDIFNDVVVTTMYLNYQYLQNEIKESGWQSYSYTKHLTCNEIKKMIDAGQIPPPTQTKKEVTSGD